MTVATKSAFLQYDFIRGRDETRTEVKFSQERLGVSVCFVHDAPRTETKPNALSFYHVACASESSEKLLRLMFYSVTSE
jgi:hypothetical protein